MISGEAPEGLRGKSRAAGRALAALGAVVLALAFGVRLLPGSESKSPLLVPTDFAILLLGGWTLALRGRIRLLSLALAGASLALLAFRSAEAIIEIFWARPLDLRSDLREAWGLRHLLLQALEPGQARLAVIGSCVLLVMILVGTTAIWSSVLRRARARNLVVGALVLFLAAASPLLGGPELLARSSLRGLCLQLISQTRTPDWELGLDQRLERTIEAQTALPSTFPRLAGADVHLLVVESYGRRFFEKGLADAAWIEDQERRLGDAGFGILSGYARPSVSGGGSAFSHMELLSGFPVPNREVFDRVLASEIHPLSRRLQEAGYLSWSIRPAMTRAWPEGKAFYGLDFEIHGAQIPYEGHRYHWGRMPDQVPLAQFLRQGVEGTPKPLFFEYISVTSHAPFSDIPAYESDWERAATPAAFRGTPARQHGISWWHFGDHERIHRAYGESVRYALRCMLGFTARLKRPSLVIIVGDHQPPGLIRDSSKAEARDVPFHILSNRKELLEGWTAFGLKPGLAPRVSEETPAFSDFLGYFCRWAQQR